MSRAAALVATAAVAASLALWQALALIRWPRARRRTNHRGAAIPVVLGGALVVGAGASGLAAAGLDEAFVPASVWVPWIALFVVGWLDDRSHGGPRGLAGHVRSLLRGSPTTGILKLVVGIAAALWVAVDAGGTPVRVTAATIVVAVGTNVWNALDVQPGRALKWGLVALVALLAATWAAGLGLFVAAAVGASLALLPLDLRERAMLGDEGSNPLGFLVGAGLALTLPTPALVTAAALLLVLQVAAETVTISRLIEGVPPLRWVDRLGRKTT